MIRKERQLVMIGRIRPPFRFVQQSFVRTSAFDPVTVDTLRELGIGSAFLLFIGLAVRVMMIKPIVLCFEFRRKYAHEAPPRWWDACLSCFLPPFLIFSGTDFLGKRANNLLFYKGCGVAAVST